MRDWMIARRESMGLTLEEMSALCGCGTKILWMLEIEDKITHPNIAARIAARYLLNVDEYNDLVAEERRRKSLPKPEKLPKLSDYYAVKYSRETRYKNKKKGGAE